MKFFQIVISIVVGMTAGCIPVVGYNMGAGLRDRVTKSMEIGKKSIVMIEKSFETGEAEDGILNGIENAERYEADIRTMKST